MSYLLCLCFCALWSVLLVATCPAESGCSCYKTSVHCSNIKHLNTISAQLPSNTSILTLQHTAITRIDASSLQHLHNLACLRIKYNNIQTIQTGAFDHLSLLTELSLTHNNISVLQPGIFSKLYNLKKLLLSNNNLVTLDKLLIGLFSLDVLVVNYNQITHLSVDTFRDNGNLRTLSLVSNNITSIHNQTFSHLRYLMDVSLATNPLYNFDIDLSYHERLLSIYLKECNLTHFPSRLPPYLHMLALQTNRIQSISKAETRKLDHLITLVLTGNQLHSIEEGALSHLNQLTTLFLNDNSLQSVPGPLPSKLQNLFLEKNSIHTILPESFQPATEMVNLSLKENNVTSITSNTFRNVKSIENLVLDSNPISELSNNMIHNETKIKTLSLNNLNLDTINTECFSGLDSLTTLDMSNVEILRTHIHGNIFKNTPNLQTLTLYNSSGLAHYILYDGVIMESLSSLVTINLMHNQLTQLNSTFVDLLPNLQEISITGNAFICDTDLFWLHTFMLTNMHKFKNPYGIHCLDPASEHRYMNLLSLKYYELDIENTTAYEDVGYTAPEYYDDYHYYDNFSQTLSDVAHFHTNETTTITITVTGTVTVVVPVNVSFASSESSTIKQDQQTSSNPLRAVGIAIGMAFAVIVIMLLLAMFIYVCCRYRQRQAFTAAGVEYQSKEDYVFIVTKADTPTETSSMPRMTREQRGSTTSRASEDITNHTDRSMMGVFTLDVDT